MSFTYCLKESQDRTKLGSEDFFARENQKRIDMGFF